MNYSNCGNKLHDLTLYTAVFGLIFEMSGQICPVCGVSSKGSENNFLDQITIWLDSNPDFLLRYLSTKSDLNLTSPITAAGASADLYVRVQSSDDALQYRTYSTKSSCSSTSPSERMRKISSHDFNFHDKKRIVTSAADGTPTFIDALPWSFPNTDTCDNLRPHPSDRKLSHLNEHELINELILDICKEMDMRSLCFKIIQNVLILLQADRGSMFLIETDPQTKEAILVGELFDVTHESTLADALQRTKESKISFPMGVGISGYVAKTGEYANIPDAYAVSILQKASVVFRALKMDKYDNTKVQSCTTSEKEDEFLFKIDAT